MTGFPPIRKGRHRMEFFQCVELGDSYASKSEEFSHYVNLGNEQSVTSEEVPQFVELGDPYASKSEEFSHYVNLGSPYASKWGVTDFYDDAKEQLEKLLASGEDFGATGCVNKEPISFTIIARGNKILCTVHKEMDEGYNLIYDAVPDGYELSEEQAEEVYRDMEMSNVVSYSDNYEELPRNATFEQICETLGDLDCAADASLMSSFQIVEDLVKKTLGISR